MQEFLQPHFKNEEIDSIFVQKVVAIYNRDKKIKIGNERVSKRTEILTSLFFTFHRKWTKINTYRTVQKQLEEVSEEIHRDLPNHVSIEQAKPILLAKLRWIEDKIDRPFEGNLHTDENVDMVREEQLFLMKALGQVNEAIKGLREETYFDAFFQTNKTNPFL